MDAEEEEEVLQDDDGDDDDEDDVTQKRNSNGLQASDGMKKSTSGFLSSLLRWSNKPQLEASESSQPSTSKQKNGTPKLPDVQVDRNTPPRQIINVTAHARFTLFVRWLLNRH